MALRSVAHLALVLAAALAAAVGRGKVLAWA